jgi:hypothetical protein
MSWVATAIAGSAVLGAGASLFGSSQQSKAAANATNAQVGMFNQGASQVAPFSQMGAQTGAQLQSALPGLTANFNPTMSDLENTPGYQFTLGQGEKATTNANSAMGLANSGVEGKGLANYAEGLASTTFQQQFQNYLQQNSQKYNMLMGPTQLGAQAGASLLGNSTSVGGNIGSNIIGAGNAGAAGVLGAAGSTSNALNQYMQWSMLQKLGMGGNNANPFAGANMADLGGGGVGTGGYNVLDAQATG